MKKQSVLITGSSRGIGKKIAECFAINDYNVMINYNKSEKEALDLMHNLRKKGCTVCACKADVSKKAEVDNLIEQTLNNFNSVDILINNAGIAETKLFNDISLEDWQNIINVNLTAVYLTCHGVLPHMLSKKDGKIINISSIWGMVGAACEVAYSTSKAGMIGLSKALAKELAPSGITVNCIAPGAIKTDMLNDLSDDDINSFIAETPLKRLGTADEIAKLALYLASSDANFFTGQVLSPNGGIVI